MDSSRVPTACFCPTTSLRPSASSSRPPAGQGWPSEVDRAPWQVTSAMTAITALFPGPHYIVARVPQQYEPFVPRSHVARLSARLSCTYEESGFLAECAQQSWVQWLLRYLASPCYSCFQALSLPSTVLCRVFVQTRNRYTLGDRCLLLGEKLLIFHH